MREATIVQMGDPCSPRVLWKRGRWLSPLMLLLFVSVTLATASCDPGPSAQRRIGVSLTDDGSAIEIHFVTCGSEHVTRVALYGGRNVDELLWEIRSQEGSQERAFVAGEAPSSFVTTVSLKTGATSSSTLVSAEIDTT